VAIESSSGLVRGSSIASEMGAAALLKRRQLENLSEKAAETKRKKAESARRGSTRHHQENSCA